MTRTLTTVLTWPFALPTSLPDDHVGVMGLSPKDDHPLWRHPDWHLPRVGRAALGNFEQLVHEGPLVVNSLLTRARGLRCLVTSRHTLSLPGEREHRVDSLPVPKEPYEIDPVAECSSVQLFLDRAQSVRPDFQLTPRNAATVAELCRKLEGIPLALELAASRVHVLTVSQILQSLSERFALLVSGKRDKAHPHRSLQAAIEWSYSLHSPEIQRLFRELSVFRGGFTADSALVICTPSGSDAHSARILDGLTQLRSHSLLHVEESGGEMRFRMLETLHEFAMQKRLESESFALDARHAAHYLKLTEDCSEQLFGGSQTDSFDRLDREHENIRAAVDWSQDNDKTAALRVLGAMWRFWRVRGHLSKGRRRLAAALESSEPQPSDLRARAISSAGILALSQGDHRAARGLMEQSLVLRRSLRDPEGIAAAVSNLGVVAYEEGDFEGACRRYEEALDIVRGLGVEWRIGVGLNNLGNSLLALGDAESARRRLEESLEIRRRLDDRDGIATSLNNLGNVLIETGDLDSAEEAENQSLGLYREVGDDLGCAFVLSSLGTIYLRRDETARCAEALVESLRKLPAFRRVWAEGGSMTLDASISLALSVR
ncbi:MAG: transcriptional regulator, family [Chthonomonadaceae bacterium]|nr:transcriptional regulator, family [Chthonomonadaceae bacterium]